MNKVNSNEEIKYLTLKDIQQMSEKTNNTYYNFHKWKGYAKVECIERINTQSINNNIEQLLYLPNKHIKFLRDFLSLFSKNNSDRYKLLNRLFDIYIQDISVFDDNISDFKIINHNQKISLLKESFNIFKKLKNRDEILNFMFSSEYDTKSLVYNMEEGKYMEGIKMDVSHQLLNKNELLDLLLKYFNFQQKEANKYKEELAQNCKFAKKHSKTCNMKDTLEICNYCDKNFSR